MDNQNNNQIPDIPAEKLRLVQKDRKLFDQKLETKSIGYFRDAWLRFKKDRSAVVAFVLIVILLLFSIIVPAVSSMNVTFRDGYYRKVTPKLPFLSGAGFWDGAVAQTETQAGYDYLNAIGVESGMPAVKSVRRQYEDAKGMTYFDLRVDSYNKVGYAYMNLSNEEYQRLMDYQDEKGFRVIYPMPATHMTDFVMGNRGANFWYKLKNEASTNSGEAVYDENGQYIPNYLTSSDREKAGYRSMRLENDNGGEDGNTWFVYAVRNQSGVKVRVNYYEYFRFKNGFDPVFYFGTNDYGQDIFSCLASGGRLSFILALSVSFINFIIGACYGAVEGYYGGAVDMVMERISDILGYMPFVVVATLFNLHLQPYVGPVVALLFAFILTGWIGMASRVRMQFYRFKGQEYVLAARTLGASDRRLIFKHIFPNSLGTIITGSVLQIPGVIFTESILSYLGIINLETSDITSIGTMLANGQGTLSTFPHIILFPALFISILEISFNLFGNGLRDAFNPSLRGAED